MDRSSKGRGKGRGPAPLTKRREWNPKSKWQRLREESGGASSSAGDSRWSPGNSLAAPAGDDSPWHHFRAGQSEPPQVSGAGMPGFGASSSRLRGKVGAKSVKQWKRGLKDRLQKYLDKNHGWRYADIDAFIEAECNWEIHRRKHLQYAVDCRNEQTNMVQLVPKHRFEHAAAAIQRVALLAVNFGIFIDVKNIESVRKDRTWDEWMAEHCIDEISDTSRKTMSWHRRWCIPQRRAHEIIR